MTTAVLTRAGRMADQVREESRQLDPVKVLLTALFVLPFVLGWAVGAAWTALAWTWTAAVVGFRAGAGRSGREGVPA